jgi:hypothetical protein
MVAPVAVIQQGHFDIEPQHLIGLAALALEGPDPVYRKLSSISL